jgi:alpha-beta hydrolase superfamily lysophospholipase
VGAAVLVVPAFAVYVAQRCYRAEAWFFSGQNHAIDREIAWTTLGDVEDVVVDVQGHALRGVYAPSRNRAAIVLCHGSAGDRYGLIAEARALRERGFGVLLFDFPGHGESAGAVHWNSDEVRAVRRMVDFLVARSDVDAQRVGVLGFSMGGYIAAVAGAQDPRLQAVAVVAAPGDARAHTEYEYQRFTWVGQRAALWALKRNGMQLDGPTPLREVASIAPRPLLIVGGERDPVVPASMIRALHAAAREPKQLVMIDGGGHGGYAALPGSGYLAALLQFFERSLVY